MVEGIVLAIEGVFVYFVIFMVNGQIFYNYYYGNIMKEGDFVFCDFGVVVFRIDYVSDIICIFLVSIIFIDWQKVIYQIVLDVEE